MHPGDDPSLAARFLEWLEARGERPAHVEADLARLTELGAWDRPTADVGRADMAEDDRRRLVELHLLWRRFRDQADADWVGKADGGDADVQWIDGSAPDDRRPPEGSAPRLVPAGTRPAPPPPVSPLRGVGQAIAVPLTLVAAIVLLHRVETGSEAALRSTIQAAHATLAPRTESAERIGRQRALARTLIDLRRRQRDVVNARCESGSWCDARVEARSRSLRLAEQFSASARSWDDEEASEESGAALLPDDVHQLQAERARLARGVPADWAEQPPPTQAEIARRLVLVDEELALVLSVKP